MPLNTDKLLYLRAMRDTLRVEGRRWLTKKEAAYLLDNFMLSNEAFPLFAKEVMRLMTGDELRLLARWLGAPGVGDITYLRGRAVDAINKPLTYR